MQAATRLTWERPDSSDIFLRSKRTEAGCLWDNRESDGVFLFMPHYCHILGGTQDFSWYIIIIPVFKALKNRGLK